MKVVADTSILIEYLRNGTLWQEFLNNAPDSVEVYLPTIVIFELFSGKSAASSTVHRDIQVLVKSFKQVDFDSDIARTAGELYRKYGKHIGVADYIIAATALSLGAEVVTLNKKHFEQIPHLPLYAF
jgi:predicted nucleic acid-binding protein